MATQQKSVAIIGAGIAGLAAGCYAQMNGYRSRIYEMHTAAGGLCTAWERKGYTIDYCIHWLVGSAPGSGLYRLWREIGLIQPLKIVNMDEFARVEDTEGRTVIFYTNLDRLESELLRISPADSELTRSFLGDARKVAGRDMPSDLPPRRLMTPWQGLRALGAMAPFMGPLKRWSKVTLAGLAARFQDPLLRMAFHELWPPQCSAFTLLMTLAWLNDGVAGYPLGGSLPMMKAVEERYRSLGGEIEFGEPVAEILVEADRAVGIRLASGRQERAEAVISAADGHATIWDMLGGRYLDAGLEDLYRSAPLFPPIVFIGLGVKRSFAEWPKTVTGANLPLATPLVAGNVTSDRIPVKIGNFDPQLAPPGNCTVTVILNADYEYWTELRRNNREEYRAEKDRVAQAIIQELDRKWPGFGEDVEMVDVSTPATLERYTGNWKASFEGWLPTPDTLSRELPRTLPGLSGFYMAGQWVMPGGGLPSGVMSGRQALQLMCRDDGVKFHAQAAG